LHNKYKSRRFAKNKYNLKFKIMNGYNRVILMGTVGSDAEVRALEGGNTVANVSIAVNESYANAAGERKTNVQWFKVEAWKGLANFLGQYGKKGTAFLVEGRLKQESYEKDGVTMYSTKVVANSINFAGTKSAGAPVAQAPVAQAPVAQAPVAQAPVAQAPVAQAPVAQAPVANAQQQVNEYTSNQDFVNGMNNGQGDDLPF
jgi:single-strand DNA-binding protein